MNTWNEIQEKQRAVWVAEQRIIEVETREAGWNAKEANEADKAYHNAVSSYKAAFDMEPEYREGDLVFSKYALYDATLERKMLLCGSMEVSI